MLLKEKLHWIVDQKRTKITNVAVAIECAPSTLYAIIQKNDADTKILRKLSEYFGIELSWWLDEKSGRNPFDSKNIQSHFNNTDQITPAQEDTQQKVELLRAKDKNEYLLNMLKEKDKMIEEKDKTIASQERTILMLHETMSIMNSNRK